MTSQQIHDINPVKDIQLNVDHNDYFYFSGNIFNCDGEPLTSAYLKTVTSKASWHTPVDHLGRYQAFVSYCALEQATVQCFDPLANTEIQRINMFTSTRSDDNNIYDCKSDEISEASVIVENTVIYFEDCTGEVTLNHGSLERIAFKVSNDITEEDHTFNRNTSKGDYWYSPSRIWDDQLKIITIVGQPELTAYTFQGKSIREVVFSSVLFENIITGQKSRGRLHYIIASN